MTRPADETLESKSFGALEIKDAERGEVVAVVATLGVVDRDGDVLLPGSFPPSAAVKMSAYGHSTVYGDPPAGKGTIVVEGNQAVFRGKFFMSTERGREAFHTTKELGPEGEWSFGFPRDVKTEQLTEEWRAKGARRLIAGLTPIEASPVFIGAGVGTGTVSAKVKEEEPALPDPAVEAAQREQELKAAAELQERIRQEVARFQRTRARLRP